MRIGVLKMEFIAFLVFLIVQIVFIPLAVIGVIIVSFRQLVVSKRLGVSSTAISAIGNRWLMDVFGLRKDATTAKLYHALPNGSAFGLWLLYLPSYIRYRISGKNNSYGSLKEEGTEGIFNIPVTRTVHFDNFIKKSIDKAEQFVVMGAGYDTRSYGGLKSKKLKFFELDLPQTQKLKKDCLKKAGIDTGHVVFVDVDFSTENWYEKLKDSGYDPGRKTIFLWEGVTIYLSENNVRKTLKEIKEHAAPGSILLADFYTKKAASIKGVKATKEGFSFGLDFSGGKEKALEEFLGSEGLVLSDFRFMGHKTKRGTLGVVAEIIL